MKPVDEQLALLRRGADQIVPLDELKQKGTYFKLRVLEDEQAPVCTFDGKKVINLASNNYLGLTTHPKLREAAIAATKKYGVILAQVALVLLKPKARSKHPVEVPAMLLRSLFQYVRSRSARSITAMLPTGLEAPCGEVT